MNIAQKGRQIVSVLIFVGAFALSGHAPASTTVEWTGDEFFDSETINFAGFEASSLDAIYDGSLFWGFASATYRDWGSIATFTLDLELAGSWTNIWTEVSDGSNTINALSNILSGGPISFSQGMVTGIRLGSTPIQFPPDYKWVLDDNNIPCDKDWCQGIDEAVSFTFGNEAPNPVPVPAAIWLFGSALIGLVGFGKRKAKVAV